MKRVLFGACAFSLAVGLWQHDWVLIGASVALAGVWWIIGEEVVDAGRDEHRNGA